mmetsp:Transcript_75753/g.190488  ORF Transcript_75753/g.190488 Transcript_75753/m.190488 type:complete len:295 (+) Transcript_75753:1326-2210(+)
MAKTSVDAAALHCWIFERKFWMAFVCTSAADEETTAAKPLAKVPMTWRCACACAPSTTEVSLSSWRRRSKGQCWACLATRDKKFKIESRALPWSSGDRQTTSTAGTHFSTTTGAIWGAVCKDCTATCTQRSVMYKSVSVRNGTMSPKICIMVGWGMPPPYFLTRCTNASRHCCLKARLFWLRYEDSWPPTAAKTLLKAVTRICEMQIVFRALMAVERVTSFLMRSTKGGRHASSGPWKAGKSPTHATRLPKHSSVLSLTSWSTSVANSLDLSTSKTGSISMSWLLASFGVGRNA